MKKVEVVIKISEKLYWQAAEMAVDKEMPPGIFLSELLQESINHLQKENFSPTI